MKTKVTILIIGLLAHSLTAAVRVTTFAGSTFRGTLDGQGQNSMFQEPSGIAYDGTNLWVWDLWLRSIFRRITPEAVVTSHWTNGYNPGGNVFVAFDWGLFVPAGAKFFLDGGIQQLYQDGNYSTICRAQGRVFEGYYSPPGVYVRSSNLLSHTIIVGGRYGNRDGCGLFSEIGSDHFILTGFNSGLWLIENDPNILRYTIRFISTDYCISTISTVSNATAIGAACEQNGVLWLLTSSYTETKLYRLRGQQLTWEAGSGWGYKDGYGTNAQFGVIYYPNAICSGPDGALYISDFSNHCIRKVEFQSEPVTATLTVEMVPSVIVSGQPGEHWTIESSDDLTIWTVRGGVTLTSTQTRWYDPDKTPQKFYRAVKD